MLNLFFGCWLSCFLFGPGLQPDLTLNVISVMSSRHKIHYYYYSFINPYNTALDICQHDFGIWEKKVIHKIISIFISS